MVRLLLAAALLALPSVGLCAQLRSVGVVVPKGAGEAEGRALAAACGLPVGAGPVTILAGKAVDGFDDVALTNLLATGAVMLDAPAAVAVTKRGFSRFIGVEATAGVPAKAAGEAFLLESAAPEGSPVAPVAGRDGATLKLLKGAEALAEFRSPDGKTLGPSMTRTLSGRGWKIVCATPRTFADWTLAHRQSFVAHVDLAAGDETAAMISCEVLVPVDAASSPHQTAAELTAQESPEELHLSVRSSASAPRASLPVRLSSKWRGATLEGRPLTLREDGAFPLPGPFAPGETRRFVFRAATPKAGESRALAVAPQLAGPRSWWYYCFLFARDKAAATHDSASVVFLGDSITQLFQGNAVWNANFEAGPYRAANFGISGDRTEHLLLRLRGGTLDYTNPRRVVLMIGTNNIGHRNDDAREIAAAVAECLRLVRAQRPNAKIILNAVFPRGRKADDPVRAKVDALNVLLRPLADGRDVLWLDMKGDYLAKDGSLPKELFPDGLHPSVKGYGLWVRRLLPLLQPTAGEALVESMRREVAAGKAAVLARDGKVVRTVEGRGIRPILDVLDRAPQDLKGAVAYDKVVGRAAAAIYVAGGAREVHADVMSRGAAAFLARHGIRASAVRMTDEIVNRRGDGICPMERRVQALEDPKKMVEALRRANATDAMRRSSVSADGCPQVHASSFVQLKDGSFVVAWFGGTREGAGDVAIWGVRRAGGDWTKPVVLAKVNSDSPHWNPVLRVADDGRLVLYFKVGRNCADWRTYFTESRDDGRSWCAARELVPGECRGGRGPVRNKCLRLPSGRWLAPASREIDRWRAFIDISDDDGRTWRATREIAMPANQPKAGVIQPTLWIGTNGIVRAYMRSNTGKVWESASKDSGETWSEAVPTSLPNNNSGIDAVRASDGCLYLALNPVAGNWASRSRLEVWKSTDEGATWSVFRVLEREERGEFSYPCLREVRPGVLVVTYTWNRKRIAFVEL